MIDTLFISTSRADFGILNNLISVYRKNSKNFKILFSGSNVSPTKLDFVIDEDISKSVVFDIHTSEVSISVEIINIFKVIYPYLKKEMIRKIILLGDRYEMFYIASIAHLLRIPVVHLHGGEVTAGSIDDSFRHSISKFSSLHFVTDNMFKKRLIKMGEHPNSVFNFGSLSVENIVENHRKITTFSDYLCRNYCVFVFHPQTLGDFNFEIDRILQMLLDNTSLEIFLFEPNYDPGRNNLLLDRNLSNRINNIENLSQDEYLKLLSNSSFIIGNSSSGIIEAPALSVPTINVGNRQQSRYMCNSIINCSSYEDIFEAIKILHKEDFYNSMIQQRIPFYKKGTAQKMFEVIENFDFHLKEYYDGN